MPNVKLRLRYGDAELEFDGDHAHLSAIADVWWERLTANLAEPKTANGDEAPHSGRPDANSDESAEKPIRRRKTRARGSRSGSESSPSDAEGGVDVNAIANSIKANRSYQSYEEKILHVRGKNTLYDKIALVCSQSGQPLTSGEIQRILRALMVKVDPANVSKTLAKNGSSFFTSKVRSAGGPPARYELTGPARTAFERRLNG